jgi:CHAD domain-containing protein
MAKGTLSKRKVKLSARDAALKPLHPGMTTEAAAALVLRGATACFADELAGLMGQPASDATHRTRVALRRLRSALEAFAPVIDPDLNRDLRRRLQNLFRTIGVVRDAEVLAGVESSAQHRLQREADRLHRRLSAKLKARHAADLPGRLAATLKGKHWRDTTEAARQLRKSGVEVLATRSLDRAWAQVSDFGPSIAALPDEVRHGLRKRLKSFRYMAEEFAPLWTTSGQKPALDPLSDLQEQLGRLNDLNLARARGLPVEEAEVLTALARSDAVWRDLLAQPPWWHSAAVVRPRSA